MNKYISIGKLLRFPSLYSDKPIIICPVDDYLIFGAKNGLENFDNKISSIISQKPDAILTYYGSIQRNPELYINQKIILNLTASTYEVNHTRKVSLHSLELALSINAAAVAVHINLNSKYISEMLLIAGEIVSEAQKYNMPVCGIIYPRGENSDNSDNNYFDLKIKDNNAYCDLITHCVSLGVDIGFDFIKTQYTGSKESFKQVIKTAGNVPIITAGGELSDEHISIKQAIDVVESGGKGISFGRNIFGREQSDLFINKLQKALNIY